MGRRRETWWVVSANGGGASAKLGWRGALSAVGDDREGRTREEPRPGSAAYAGRAAWRRPYARLPNWSARRLLWQRSVHGSRCVAPAVRTVAKLERTAATLATQRTRFAPLRARPYARLPNWGALRVLWQRSVHGSRRCGPRPYARLPNWSARRLLWQRSVRGSRRRGLGRTPDCQTGAHGGYFGSAAYAVRAGAASAVRTFAKLERTTATLATLRTRFAPPRPRPYARLTRRPSNS
jgi:hypothetical protein